MWCILYVINFNFLPGPTDASQPKPSLSPRQVLLGTLNLEADQVRALGTWLQIWKSSALQVLFNSMYFEKLFW